MIDQEDETVLCQRCGVITRESRVDRAGHCYGCGGAVPQDPEPTPATPGPTLAAKFCEGFQALASAARGCARCGHPFADHTLGQPREWSVSIPGEWTQRDLAKFRRGLARLLEKHPGART